MLPLAERRFVLTLTAIALASRSVVLCSILLGYVIFRIVVKTLLIILEKLEGNT